MEWILSWFRPISPNGWETRHQFECKCRSKQHDMDMHWHRNHQHMAWSAYVRFKLGTVWGSLRTPDSYEVRLFGHQWLMLVAMHYGSQWWSPFGSTLWKFQLWLVSMLRGPYHVEMGELPSPRLHSPRLPTKGWSCNVQRWRYPRGPRGPGAPCHRLPKGHHCFAPLCWSALKPRGVTQVVTARSIRR